MLSMFNTAIDTKTARRISRAHNNGSDVVTGHSHVYLSVGDVLALNSELPHLVRTGTTDEITTCELCGKANLKKTVVFRVLDSGAQEIFLGSDCAESVDYARRYVA